MRDDLITCCRRKPPALAGKSTLCYISSFLQCSVTAAKGMVPLHDHHITVVLQWKVQMLRPLEKVAFVLSWHSKKSLVSGEILWRHQDKMLNSSIWHSVTHQPRPFKFLLTQMVRAPAPILSLTELLQSQRWVEKKCCCLLPPPPPPLLLTQLPDTHLGFSQRWDPHSF